MPKFNLTNKAVEDLSKIWNYTVETWSEKQADTYYKMLISTCQQLADNPDLGKNYDGVIKGLFGVKTNRHIVFYRSIDNESVEITRILHE
jgi:toxin ParE1/3/4